MDKTFTNLDPVTAEELAAILELQQNTSFSALVETDKWLTQQNFLVNAGGAAAVLGYLSIKPTPMFAVIPLLIFLVGVIANGFEIRFLLKIHSEFHSDAIRRRSGFVSDKLTIAEAADVKAPNKSSKIINQYCGYVAQGAFILGCIVGIFGFLCKQARVGWALLLSPTFTAIVRLHYI